MKISGRILAVLAAAALLALIGARVWHLPDQRRITQLNLSLDGFEFDPNTWPAAEGLGRSGRRGRGIGRQTGALRFGRSASTQEQEASSALRIYSGLGLGFVQVSMNLDDPGIIWTKDKSTRRSRFFTGLVYAISPNLLFGVEYRAVAAGVPLFALDLGGQRFELDNPFQDHLVDLKLRYSL